MKATIAYLADASTENYGKQLMLSAHKISGTGFEAARLPLHVSLKQPFIIPGLKEMESFFDEFAKGLGPVEFVFDSLQIYKSNVFGYDSGCLSLAVRQERKLMEIQNNLFLRLEKRFGECPADHDKDYSFHMTIAIGGTLFQEYGRAYEEMSRLDYTKRAVFDRLGLFYYDSDEIKQGTYFCYKTVELEEKG